MDPGAGKDGPREEMRVEGKPWASSDVIRGCEADDESVGTGRRRVERRKAVLRRMTKLGSVAEANWELVRD